MDAMRLRFGPVLEWALAACVVGGAAMLVSIAAGELPRIRPVIPVMAGEAPVDDRPAGVPPRSVSVPLLLLDNGGEIRLGDRAAEVAARLGTVPQVISESLDRSELRQRITRFYNYLGTQFVLVFEDAGANADPTVAAIYLR